METALRALSHKDKASDEEALTPTGFEVIGRVENPVDKAQLLRADVSNLPEGPWEPILQAGVAAAS